MSKIRIKGIKAAQAKNKASGTLYVINKGTTLKEFQKTYGFTDKQIENKRKELK